CRVWRRTSKMRRSHIRFSRRGSSAVWPFLFSRNLNLTPVDVLFEPVNALIRGRGTAQYIAWRGGPGLRMWNSPASKEKGQPQRRGWPFQLATGGVNWGDGPGCGSDHRARIAMLPANTAD